jgi:Rrf2 family protein
MGPSSRFPLAVHVLVALSFRPKQFVSSDALAGTVHTNPVVVRRVVASLRRAGCVASQPGVAGGVRLARSAGRISLLDVYRALGGGGLFRMHHPNPACPIGRRIPDALAAFLPHAEQALERSLAGVTVRDVAKRVWPDFFVSTTQQQGRRLS